MQYRASLTCILFLVLSIAVLPAANAATSGEAVLFDGVTYSFTSFSLYDVTYQDGGDGTLIENFAAVGMSYYEGATMAEDRLLICDETDGGGEDVLMLIGPNPATHEFDSSATLDYIMDRTAGGSDPMPIEWVSDISDGSGVSNDQNVWIARASNFQASALDQDGFLGPGSFVDWASATTTIALSDVVSLEKCSASCKSVDGSRIYFAGSIIVGPSDHQYGYKVLDVATGALLSDYAVLLPQFGPVFGPDPAPNQEPWHFAFNGMATDRVNGYFYCLVKNGSLGAEERWMYRLTSLPDPNAGMNINYNDPALQKVRIDTVIDYNLREDRVGLCTGRGVDTGIGVYPVIYLINGDDSQGGPPRLYTFVPQVTDVTSVGAESWQGYR